ncbi:MAG: hypothetical protein ABIK11_06215 [candidate division WOR-3 bacterium]
MSHHFVRTLIAIICISLPAQADVLIHSGGADFTVAGDVCTIYHDTVLMFVAVNIRSRDYEYYSTDLGQTWIETGGGTSSDTTLARVFSFIGDGDSAAFYCLFNYVEDYPNSLAMVRERLFNSWSCFMNFGPDELPCHEFAGCTDHPGAQHYIYIAVSDTTPGSTRPRLFFQRSTDYGWDFFPPIDSFYQPARNLYLAGGTGRYVYFAGVAGPNRDTLLLWINRNRLEPGNWLFHRFTFDGDRIENPAIAAGFNAADSLATVWCAFARNRNNSGNWDIDYIYSTNGGHSWSGVRTLAGDPEAEERFFDLQPRRYGTAGEVTVAYLKSSSAGNQIFISRVFAAEPENWSTPLRMNEHEAAAGWGVRPKVCYLPGLPDVMAGVVYLKKDSSGCYWSSLYPGIAEFTPATAPRTGKYRVLPGAGIGPFRIDGAGEKDRITVADASGRVVAYGRNGFWDGKRIDGSPLPAGVYLVQVNREPAGTVIITR